MLNEKTLKFFARHGSEGGRRRMAALSKEQRSALAKRAAESRWGKRWLRFRSSQPCEEQWKRENARNWISTTDFAKQFKLKPRTVRYWVAAGKLHGCQITRDEPRGRWWVHLACLPKVRRVRR